MGVSWVSYPRLSPWVIALDVFSLAVIAFAVVRSWRSAERVVRENRSRTRAWRIFVAVIVSPSINGVILPLSAIYALSVYRAPSRREQVSEPRP